MFGTILALLVRIISNPVANFVQKLLSVKHSSVLINAYSYGFLTLFFLYPALKNYSWGSYGGEYWLLVCFAGLLCTSGTICLIKALQYGEMSILGPINSYKCVVGLVLAAVFLGEIPTVAELWGVLLIIYGSWYIFDTIENGGIINVIKRKDILLRFVALILTGGEAVVIKKIILMSSAPQAFILWCFTGFLFSLFLLGVFKIKPVRFSGKDILLTLAIAVCLGAMQLSTNIVFQRMNVGLSLALFQLSGIIAVIFGWKVFGERNIRKKLLGVLIMLVGSSLILIK